MAESRWIIQFEKTCENKLTIRFGGRLQLALKPVLGWLVFSAAAFWNLWR